MSNGPASVSLPSWRAALWKLTQPHPAGFILARWVVLRGIAPDLTMGDFIRPRAVRQRSAETGRRLRCALLLSGFECRHPRTLRS